MFLDSIKKGLKKGIDTTFMLGKIMVPVYFVVTIINHTPLIDWISIIFQPLMEIFNLPGEAAIVLVIGNFLSLYAAIGAMGALALTPTQITTLAMMLSFSHSLLVETAITKKLGLKLHNVLLVRVGLAVFTGFIISRVGVAL